VTQRARFTQADIARVLKGAKRAGVDVQARIEPDGTIVVLTGQGIPANDANPLDRVLQR
jgi:hypothetical protein